MEITTIALGALVIAIWVASLIIASSVLSRRVQKKRRAAIQKIHRRKISVLSKIDGARKCYICTGIIKVDLASIDCSCGNHFHTTCGARVGICPSCGKPIEVKSMDSELIKEQDFTPIRIMPLSKEDRLYLLEDKFLVGEIDEKTYKKMKEEEIDSLPEPITCATCGDRKYPGEKCLCTEIHLCPECGNEMSDSDVFCRRCGVVFSDNFDEELFQCSACEKIVSGSERICTCGALLLDPGDSLCPECDHPVTPMDRNCPNCGRIRIIELLECPSCGKEVGPSDFECECGAIFQDMIERIECPNCNSAVDLEDGFCRSCGIQFEKDGYSSIHR